MTQVTQMETPTIIPLMLHRPAGDSDSRRMVPRGFGCYSVLPFTCLPHADYPAFEFQKPFDDIPLKELRSFCKQVQPAAPRKTKPDCIETILTWQKAVLIELGFIPRKPYQLVNLFDWGKAIRRRSSYEEDRCSLIDATGYMEISSAMANLSMFIQSPDRGYVQILTVDLESGGWGGYRGTIITDAWKLGQGVEEPVWLEPARHASREEFLQMVSLPESYDSLPDEQVLLSAAVYEARKYQRVLSNAVEELESTSALEKKPWDVELYSSEYSSWAEQRIIDFDEMSPSESVRILCRGPRHRDSDSIEYLLPVAIAPLFLLAFFSHFQAELKQAKNYSGELLFDQMDEPIPEFSHHPDQESFNLFFRWLKQLEAFAPWDERLLEYFQRQTPSTLTSRMCAELEKIRPN